jgi:hypothetical protein
MTLMECRGMRMEAKLVIWDDVLAFQELFKGYDVRRL